VAHINAQLPEEVELGAVRRDDIDVEITRTDGGSEVRNSRWDQSLLAFDCAYPASLRNGAIFQQVRAAYKAAGGKLHSFDFQDWSEYQATDEPLGTSDGVITTYDLIKTYTFGSETHERRIYRPVSPIVLKGDGVVIGSGYSVNYTTGVVTFSVVPANGVDITWTGEFNVPVRFDTPLASTGIATHLEHIDTFTLVEVRL
jgi:uncharacterized protein (TIGR02217 family)